jgi:hypothetical protein
MSAFWRDAQSRLAAGLEVMHTNAPLLRSAEFVHRHSILEPRHIPAPLDVNLGPQQFTGSSASFLPKTKCLPNLPKQKNSWPEIFLCKKAHNFRLYVMKESRGGVIPR